MDVAISISESSDLSVLGLGSAHLQDAMVEIARHLLASGARLSYAGDLRPGGFSELLFELVARHHPEWESGTATVVANYLAWPVHMEQSNKKIEVWAQQFLPFAALKFLDKNGMVLSDNERLQQVHVQPTSEDWSLGLTSMRWEVTTCTDARVLLGGRVEEYKGRMPGVAEEALISLYAGKPVFLLGGFGGCVRDIAETMNVIEYRQTHLSEQWESRQSFAAFSAEHLRNGLTTAENEVLASTPHIDQAIALVQKGLRLVSDSSTQSK